MWRLTFLALALPCLALSQEPPDEEVKLEVKPVLCITDKRNPDCSIRFVVAWEGPVAGYYCLFNDFSDEPLRCWADERLGRTTDDRTVDESFSFWLTGQNAESPLAEVDVEVLRLDSDDRRRRRRTRHVWDIN